MTLPTLEQKRLVLFKLLSIKREMISPADERQTTDSVESRIHEVQAKIKKQKVIVALLGAGGRGSDERRSLASELRRVGFNTIIAEDILPPEISPSIAERELLSWPELDLAFVSVQSWGTVTEFAEHGGNSFDIFVPQNNTGRQFWVLPPKGVQFEG